MGVLQPTKPSNRFYWPIQLKQFLEHCIQKHTSRYAATDKYNRMFKNNLAAYLPTFDRHPLFCEIFGISRTLSGAHSIQIATNQITTEYCNL